MPGLGAAIGGIIGAFKATAIGHFLTSTLTGRLLGSVALSALQAARARRSVRPSGITTQSTATGGTNPLGFILGNYATAGDAVCPPMSHGEDGKTPNAYLTYVIELGDIAGQTLSRVAIDGAWVTLGSTAEYYGKPVGGRFEGYAWVKYYDGSQTTADAMLLEKYGSYAERPWAADMVGAGICYAILTFRFNRELFSGFPQVIFECGGIKLYDPRKDSTVGGSGAHRWGELNTYEASVNAMVLAYNVARGITIPGLSTWGGRIAAANLPLANWMSAMATCSVGVGSPAAEQFRAGFEVRVDMDPADVMDELLKVSAASFAEVGGQFKVRVGGPGLPVMFITDDDIIVTRPQDYDPFPGAEGRQNGIDAKYPAPAALYAEKSAPSIYNATWEAEDGERRVVALDLPACPYPAQVQRIMRNYIKDERRFRRYVLVLPPDAVILEPLDTISWTSVRNGFSGKLFEVASIDVEERTLLVRASLREIDPSDYDWSEPVTTYDPSSVEVVPAAQTLPGWSASPAQITDHTGAPRRPAVRLAWIATGLDAVDAVQYQIKVTATGAIVARGRSDDIDDGEIVVADGILRNVQYSARGRPIARGRRTAWTSWDTVTAPDVGLAAEDLTTAYAAEIAANIAATAAAQDQINRLTLGMLEPIDSALSIIGARSRAGLKGWIVDPVFARWSGAPLNLTAAAWSSRSGTSTYASKVSGEFGTAMAVAAPTGSSVVQVIAAAGAGMVLADAAADYVMMTLHVEYTSGDPTGAYARVQWSPDGTTWTNGDALGATAQAGLFSTLGIVPNPGVRQVVEVLWRRPAGISGYIRAVLNPKSASPTTAQNMIIHLWNVGPATQEQIDAGKVYTVASSTPGTTVTVQGIGAAMAQTNTALNAQTGGLQASVTDIKSVSTSLLSGTALGALLTQLNVTAGVGTSAWVTDKAAAIATLQGNAAASLVFRVGAGGASAGVELVAADNPVSGPASVLKLDAKHVEVTASTMRLSAADNQFPDFNMVDPAYYVGTFPTYTFISTTAAPLGDKYVSIPSNAAASYVFSDWFPVLPDTEYAAVAYAWLATAGTGAGDMRVYLDRGSVDATGAVTVINSDLIKQTVDASYSAVGAKGTAAFLTDSSTRRARWRMLRMGGGTQAGRAGGLQLNRKTDAFLVVDGAIQANHLAAGSVQTTHLAAGSITAAKLAAGQIIAGSMIVDGAVSKTYARSKTGSTVNITTTTSPGTIVIPSFAVAFEPDRSADNPLVFQIFGRCFVTATAPAKLNFVLQAFFAGVWNTIGIGQPFHLISTGTGTDTHHFSYGYYDDGYYDPGNFQNLRLCCYVSSTAPFSSHAVSIDYLTLTAQQVNK